MEPGQDNQLTRENFVTVIPMLLASAALAACQRGTRETILSDLEVGDRSTRRESAKPFPFEWREVTQGDTFGEIIKNPAYKDSDDLYAYISRGVILRRQSGETFAILGEAGLLASMASNWFGVSTIGEGDSYVAASADKIRSYFEGDCDFTLSGIVEGSRKEDGSVWVTKVELDARSRGQVTDYMLKTKNLLQDGWSAENWILQSGQ